MAKIIPKIKEVATISIQGIFVAQYCINVLLNMYVTCAAYSLYSRTTNMNIKPKNNVVKNKIAVAKFLNYIRGMAEIFFPFFLSTFSISLKHIPNITPTAIAIIVYRIHGISHNLSGPTETTLLVIPP